MKIQRGIHLEYIWVSSYSNLRSKSTFIFENSGLWVDLSSLIESAVLKLHQFEVEVYETTLKFNEEFKKNYCRSPTTRMNDVFAHFSIKHTVFALFRDSLISFMSKFRSFPALKWPPVVCFLITCLPRLQRCIRIFFPYSTSLKINYIVELSLSWTLWFQPVLTKLAAFGYVNWTYIIWNHERTHCRFV